jgi:hypothetical protein
MSKDEVLIISVLILQSVNTFLNVRKVLKSRCTSVVDIERDIQFTRDGRTLDR